MELARQEEEIRRKEEERKRQDEDKRRKDEEKRRKEEEERKKKDDERKRREADEKKKKEEDKRRKEEEDRKRKEEEEDRKRQEEEKRAAARALPKFTIPKVAGVNKPGTVLPSSPPASSGSLSAYSKNSANAAASSKVESGTKSFSNRLVSSVRRKLFL